MKILQNTNDLNIVINSEQNFQTDLGWQDNLVQFEDEVLKDIINPVDNYETVRYIHEPYNKIISGTTLTQTDIWFQFYFSSGLTYIQDYEAVGITKRENELMLKQSTESFFRLEFFKTPKISGSTYEAPTRQNRRIVFTKNLSLPLGEKFFYTGPNFGYHIHVPVFMGSNYKNKENMYLFWFEDETVLEETDLIGTETGNTFFMTAKFFNAKDGQILDFTNRRLSTGVTIDEKNDMYYQVDFNLTDRTYQIYKYTEGTKGDRVGISDSGLTKTIQFFEKGGGILSTQPVFIPPTPTPTPIPGLEDQVDFVITKTCVGQIGYVTIGNGSGGSGLYQFGQAYYSSSTDASTSTNYRYSDGESWTNIPDGTWYFVMRDNSDYNNKVVKSVVVNCDSNPPNCVTGVTFNITATPQEMFYQDCQGNVQSVMYTTTGYKTIFDCLQVNSLNSYDYNYDNVIYASTTCLPSTPTPTPTPTVTPTPTPIPFSDITSDPKVSGAEACSSIMFNPDPTVGNGTTFCNSTTLTNPAYGQFPTGTYYIHYNFQYVQVSITNGNNTVQVTGPCTPCPTPTPTPTVTPTPTATPTLFSDITSDPKVSGAEACGSIMFNPDPTVGNGTTFCNSTTLTNPSYGQLPTGTYYIHYNFNYRQVSLTNGNNTVMVTGPCTPCPTPTPTPTPAGTPTATFSTSTIYASRPSGSAGTTIETSGTTITVTDGSVTLRLSTWVNTGYRSNTSLTIGINTYTPGESGQGVTGGTGISYASSTTFTLGVGTYNITNWTVSAISDGTQSVVQAKLEQVV